MCPAVTNVTELTTTNDDRQPDGPQNLPSSNRVVSGGWQAKSAIRDWSNIAFAVAFCQKAREDHDARLAS